MPSTTAQAIIALQAVQMQIAWLEKRIHQVHRTNPASKRLEAIPGFGVIVSTAVVATMPDPKAFKTGREFAAWIGLVPRQNSTGGKDRLGSISKQGDRYLRRLLVVGALAVIRSARARPDKYPWWLPCWTGGQPRWSPWRWPTRWRAWPGRYWPRARPIERRHTQAAERLRPVHKELGNGNVRSRRERKGTSRVMMA
jgi:transposase